MPPNNSTAMPEINGAQHPFSTRELALLLGCNMLLAQRTAYCLRMIQIVEPAGRRRRTPLHRRTPEAALRT